MLPNALCHYRKINNPKNTGGGGKGNPFRFTYQTLASGSETARDRDVPVILPFPCPHCGEKVREEVGRLMTNRQAVCSFCGLIIDLGREQMIAVIDKVQEALSRGGAGGDDGQ